MAVHWPQFRCELGYRRDLWIVRPFGELDIATVPQVRRSLRWVRRHGAAVALDLRGLTFMDSSGLHLAIELRALAERDGFDLFVVRGGRVVQRVLALAGVEALFTIVDTLEELSAQAAPLEHAVIAVDMHGRVELWNATAELLYGWSEREALGRPVLDLLVAPHDQELGEEIAETVRTQGVWEGDFVVQRRDGTHFVARVRDTLVQDDGGNPIGMIGLSVPARLPADCR